MNKIATAAILCLILLFSASTPVSATHSDSFTHNAQQTDVSYKYDGPGMDRFVFLQQASARKNVLMESLQRWPEQQEKIIHNLTNGRGVEGLISVSMILIATVVLGAFFEALIGYKLNRVSARLAGEDSGCWKESVNLLLMRGVFRFLGLGVFALSSCVLPIVLYEATDPFRLLTLNLLGLVVKIRALTIVLDLVLAPYASGLRLMKMECESARSIYYWMLGFISFYLVSTTLWRLLAEFSLEPIMFALVVPLNGLLLNVASISVIWFNRKEITRLFTDREQQPSAFTRTLSQIWPTIITFWLLVIWTIWAVNEFLGNYEQAAQVTAAWWLTFSFPILDRLIFAVLNQLKRVTWLQSYSFERRCDVFISRVIIVIRIILLSAIIHHIINGFGYNTLEMLVASLNGVMDKAIDVVMVLILAYAAWEVIQSAIERHLPREATAQKDDGMSTLEGEGGGSGASRSETLLPLVRSFLMVFLVVCVTLTSLSIMGVEIAPLLAGAGIVGIAVGFGAQKLVQDVISGIFFLLDDAFRRGEYIEAAGLRGTVERISIRSIRLRHHLGAIQTIPFGEMATVKNLSRDWITMKLEFRLDYRSDVEKVRKLIKKVGQKMLEHEEYGEHFLLPLKSQGVTRVEESALIFRMKFTCVPGEQWIIRREAFRLVKETLEANDIHFAHRSVHVLMPEIQDPKIKDVTEQTQALQLKAGAAAALSVSPELRRNSKIDDEKANPIGADSDSV
ncbi:MAG: mechanosensitive ion channel family protein [Amphritea sp.]